LSRLTMRIERRGVGAERRLVGVAGRQTEVEGLPRVERDVLTGESAGTVAQEGGARWMQPERFIDEPRQELVVLSDRSAVFRMGFEPPVQLDQHVPQEDRRRSPTGREVQVAL